MPTTPPLSEVRLATTAPYRTAEDLDVVAELLDLRGARVLELGCGAAWTTRNLMQRFAPAHIVATEVDRIQHEKNLQAGDIPGVSFRYGGAEAIADADGSFDAVLMFKSLHHVPMPVMDQALGEIHRVLRPGGQALFLEPVYEGPFNDLLRLFNDEGEVRTAAVATLNRALAQGRFTLEAEVFYETPGTYETWETFEDRFLKVTHTELDIDAARYEQIRSAFLAHMTPTGAHFRKPHRVDLLRRA
jgi:ubiquinone/menaquinone biosynthesis C-methylase UbiE